MNKKITLLVLLVVVTITTSKLNAQSLVAHYKFDNSLNDETGTYNLTASSGFTPLFTETGQDGTTNGAVSGFSASDILETAINFEIDGNESRTMAAWIKVTTLSNGGLAVVGLGSAATGARWTFGTQGDKARIEIQGSGFNAVASPLTVDTWYHIAVVFDNFDDSAKLFVNGVKIDSRTWNNVNTTAAPLRVGNDYNAVPPVRGFTGVIDDLRIYAGAGTDAFVLNLYSTTVLAVNIQSSELFNSYPNPVVDRLHFSSNTIHAVNIYSVLGSKISSQKVKDGVDMSNFPKGIYLVKCEDVLGQHVATIKAVKK
ncbi:LamG-like jellyroll fold domain-containing protein [Mariniflexile sp.]|uniref:LamG-like jellyroll fold domain-containing protein n=1 Tax=Mariniflexile sp. TaxID=1979402 RepID=UPI003561B71C